MIKLFKSTFICSIAGYVIIAAAIVLDVLKVIPGWVTLTAVIVVILLEYLIVFWAMKKYAKLCDMVNTDLNSFIEKHDKLAQRSKQTKMMVYGNTIAALLYHERTDEAERRIDLYRQNLQPNDLISRYQCSLYIIALDVLKRDFSQIDFYVNDMKMCMQQIETSKMLGYSTKVERRMKLALEQSILEAEFYSRNAQRLRNEDRHIVDNYLANIGRMYSIAGSIVVMKGFYICSLDYESGVAYAVLGEEEKAKSYFTKVAQTNYTYPIVQRAKDYLSTGDLSILINNFKETLDK